MPVKILLKVSGPQRLSQEERNALILKRLNISNRNVTYTESGQPYIWMPGDFSLSHKDNVFLAVLNTDQRYSVGCDLEIFPTSTDFPFDVLYGRLPQQERLFVDSNTSGLTWEKKLLSLFVCKEALFKASADLKNRSAHLVFLEKKEDMCSFLYRVQGVTRGHLFVEDQQDHLLGVCLLERTT
ncbi:hypothetical protein AZI86_06065 [Bdellovibrio bacteriovorus]|uniref:4'-phosphopantetheinyl transferase domain-containing protein n=2 Tax=Bdellovibrio bacteriovorus TaxID=959 RepID=A0A150WQD4_BDEBC|nr:hypothetical protein AZI86_06065 [Bdellovibrio bacteriovorus]